MKEFESPSFRPTREHVTRRSRPGELLVLIISMCILEMLYSATEGNYNVS